jgi:hypothetical protein
MLQPGPLVYDDESHEYRLGGQRAKSVTAVAKLVPDDFALQAWDRRQIVVGLVKDPDLIERAAAAIDNRDALDRVVNDAKRAAGAHRMAERGSAMHRVLEWTLLGRTGLLLTARQRADADALRRTLDRFRLSPTKWVEGFVAYPEHLVAGRFDAILERPDGTPILVDLKSGANAVAYPQSAALQIAMYANAPYAAASVQNKGDRSVVSEWTTLPANLDRARGYVLLVEPGEAVGTLHAINIEHGWAAAQLALRIVSWRKDFNYGRGLAREVRPAKDLPANTAGGASNELAKK